MSIIKTLLTATRLINAGLFIVYVFFFVAAFPIAQPTKYKLFFLDDQVLKVEEKVWKNKILHSDKLMPIRSRSAGIYHHIHSSSTCTHTHTHTHIRTFANYCGLPSRLDKKLDPWLSPLLLPPPPPVGSIWFSSDWSSISKSSPSMSVSSSELDCLR